MATRKATLSRRPRVARPLTGRGALPKLENLVTKTPEEPRAPWGGSGSRQTSRRSPAAPKGLRVDRQAREAWAGPRRGSVGERAEGAERRVKSSLVDATRAAIRLYRLERVRQGRRPRHVDRDPSEHVRVMRAEARKDEDPRAVGSAKAFPAIRFFCAAASSRAVSAR